MNQSPRTTQNTWIAEITQNTTIIGSINTTKWSKLFSSQMISFSWIKPFLFCSKVNSVLLLHSEWHLGQSSNVHLRWRARNGDPLENDKDFFNLSWRSPSCDLLVNILDSCQRPPSKYSRSFSIQTGDLNIYEAELWYCQKISPHTDWNFFVGFKLKWLQIGREVSLMNERRFQETWIFIFFFCVLCFPTRGARTKLSSMHKVE